MSKSLFKKLRFKYKILIINENTFEEKLNFKLSPLMLFLHVGFFTVFSFAVISMLIFVTPLKYYLPGYADVSVKGDLIKESIRVDSLQANINIQNHQFEILKQIIKNEISIDSVNPKDSLTLASWDKLQLDKSASEKQLAKEYEEDAKYNLSSINIHNSTRKTNANIFIKPTDGIIIKDTLNKNNYRINIATTNNIPVLAITKGSIINISSSNNNNYKVIIQHASGFLSIYDNVENILKKVNDNVESGEVFAFVGNSKKRQNPMLIFELWLNGEQQNPKDYIIF